MLCDVRKLTHWICCDFEPRVRVDERAGAYARSPEESAPHLYGIADMACVFYTLGCLTDDAAARAEWVGLLQGLQDPESGYLLARPEDHSPLHNTAFALGALNLFDAAPLHPLAFARQWDRAETLRAFLDTIDWRTRVYSGSHNGAGLAATVTLVPGTVDEAWFDAYFAYTDAKFDAANGMMGDAKPPGGDFDQVGGTFHYAFLYQHVGREMPFPEARTDAILGLQLPSGNWHDGNVWWLTLDALYLLTRDQRRVAHRPRDVRAAVVRAVEAAAERLADPATLEAMTPHRLTATVSLLTVAQQYLGPEEIASDRPLALVLDRRPFI